MDRNSPAVLRQLVSQERQWLPPSSGADLSALRALVSLSAAEGDSALKIIDMQFLETIEWVDLAALKYLEKLARDNPVYLVEVLSSPSFAAGITDPQAVRIPLLYLKGVDPPAAERIENLPWVQDGIVYFSPGQAPLAYLVPHVLEPFKVLALVDAASTSGAAFGKSPERAGSSVTMIRWNSH